MNPRDRKLEMTTTTRRRFFFTHVSIRYFAVRTFINELFVDATTMAQQWQSNHNKRKKKKENHLSKMWAFGLSSNDFSWGIKSKWILLLIFMNCIILRTAYIHQCADLQNATREMPWKWKKLIPFRSGNLVYKRFCWGEHKTTTRNIPLSYAISDGIKYFATIAGVSCKQIEGIVCLRSQTKTQW